MDERALEIKVGAIVVAAAAAAVAVLYLLGSFEWVRGASIYVDLGHAGGVHAGAPAKMGGVLAGRVRKVHLLPDRRDEAGLPLPVRLEVAVRPEALSALGVDAVAQVSTQGPLGEPYLELLPGRDDAPRLLAGASLRGVEAPRLETLAARLATVADAVTRALGEDPRGVAAAVEGVARLSGAAEETLRQNQAALAQALRDLAQLAAVLRRDVPPLLEQAVTAARGLSGLAGGLTEADGDRLQTTLVRLEQLAGRWEEISRRIEAGEGSLGGFYKDPAVYQDLKALVTDLRKHPWKMLWKE